MPPFVTRFLCFFFRFGSGNDNQIEMFKILCHACTDIKPSQVHNYINNMQISCLVFEMKTLILLISFDLEWNTCFRHRFRA